MKMPISRINEYIAIHINDTHPALCVPEMMRIYLMNSIYHGKKRGY